MTFQRIPEREQKIQKLVDYLSKKESGDAIGYVDVERDTGLSMRSQIEHRLFFVALRRLNMHWIPKPGYGVILSSADNAVDISTSRFRRARRSISRFGQTAQSLVSKHGGDMTQYNKNILLQDVGLAGALKASATAHHVTREAAIKEGAPPSPMLPRKM